MTFGPLRFHPGQRVRYALVKLAKAGMGPRGPEDRRPVRLGATVVGQAHPPVVMTRSFDVEAGSIIEKPRSGPHNVLIEFANGRRVVTTWAQCRKERPAVAVGYRREQR